MRHFEANHRNAAAVTRESTFDGFGDRPGEEHYFAQEAIGQVEKLIDLHFGHDERMTFPQGKDIQEGEESFVLCYFVRRYFSRDKL
jgi:predicted Zn-dependent protease